MGFMSRGLCLDTGGQVTDQFFRERFQSSFVIAQTLTLFPVRRADRDSIDTFEESNFLIMHPFLFSRSDKTFLIFKKYIVQVEIQSRAHIGCYLD